MPKKLTKTTYLPRVRCAPGELAVWRQQAKDDGRTLAGWIRQRLNEAANGPPMGACMDTKGAGG